MTSPATSPAPAAVDTITPYLTVADGTAAIEFYSEAFGAVEDFRVVGDDGRIGHAELTIGPARIMLSDEYPEIDVVAPSRLGGTPAALYLPIADCDAAHARAVDAGARSVRPPADQAHGNRTATVIDPFGHRWMLSQQLEVFDLDVYSQREDPSFTVRAGTGSASSTGDSGPGQIWAALNYRDARAGIRFLVEVLGFEVRLLVPDEHDSEVVVHSELQWPEGGVVQASTARPGSPHTERPTGAESLYVVTADPVAVWQRCLDAGVEVVDALHDVDYGGEPTPMFGVRDPEGNIWVFGSYGG